MLRNVPGSPLGYKRTRPDSNDAGEPFSVTPNRFFHIIYGASTGVQRWRNARADSGKETRSPHAVRVYVNLKLEF